MSYSQIRENHIISRIISNIHSILKDVKLGYPSKVPRVSSVEELNQFQIIGSHTIPSMPSDLH